MWHITFSWVRYKKAQYLQMALDGGGLFSSTESDLPAGTQPALMTQTCGQHPTKALVDWLPPSL